VKDWRQAEQGLDFIRAELDGRATFLVHPEKSAASPHAPDLSSDPGIVGRFVTDWSGPGAVLTDVNIRLGAPNYADDTMTLTGTVTAKDDAPAEVRGGIEVTVKGSNSLGDHVTGTVRLRLPAASAAAAPGGAR